jgi:transcriptional regulator
MASGSAARGGIPKLTGVYLPRHFTARDRAAVEAFVDNAGAADLVTFDGTKPVASLIPIIWDRPAGAQDGGGHGRLLGHLALANPQWRSAGPDTVALAIVHGPQAYISPSWYPSTARHGKVVPTWNYVSVHITGRLTVQQAHRPARGRPAVALARQ